MEQIYQFRDWTSASRMKNKFNKRLKIDVGAIRDDDRSSIVGYQLSVYDSVTNEVVYKFYIDYGKDHIWNLTTPEAIDALNRIGFPCEFLTDTVKISNDVRNTLNALLALGYSHIRKDSYDVYVSGRVRIKDPYAVQPEEKLDKITNYNYKDFWFLSSTPTSIKGLLEESNE